MNNKKSVERFKDARRKDVPLPVSELEHRANCDAVLEMIFAVAERIPKDAPDDNDVTIDELMLELKNGVKSQPVIVQASDGRRIRLDASGNEIELPFSGDSCPPDDVFVSADARERTNSFDEPPPLGEGVSDIALKVRDRKFKPNNSY